MLLNKVLQRVTSYLISLSLVIPSSIFAQNPLMSERVVWQANETNTSISSVPSDIRYFKFYDVLPDEINLPIYKDLDVSSLEGRKLFVGYGTVDPGGNMCRYVPSLGRTECLPWWRVEREYSVPDQNASTGADFIKNLTILYPPKRVQYCQEWKTSEYVEGGQVTCASYYDKRKSVECLANPVQSKCFVDQCSNGIKQYCTYKGTVEGVTTTLQSPIVGNNGVPVAVEMMTDLKTYQYECPSGYIPNKECSNWTYAVMYPYECKAPSSSKAKDGEYLYCNTGSQPLYENGQLIGIVSNDKCSDGTAMNGALTAQGRAMCSVNTWQQTQKVCKSPIYEAQSSMMSQDIIHKRTFHDHEVSVLFGDEVGDSYASNPMCLRLNTIEGARQQSLQVKISGTGSLDDDIYVIAHKSNGSYNKIYCNMQHNEASSGTAKKWVVILPAGLSTTGNKQLKAVLKLDTNEETAINKTIQVVTSGATSNGTIDINSQGIDTVNLNSALTFVIYSSAVTQSVALDLGSGVINAVLDSSSSSFVNKSYAGDILQCIDNDGSYTFNQTIPILASDVVTVQEASEFENSTHETMFTRNHYGSSAVTIDGVLAAPATSGAVYPSYPGFSGCHGMTCLKTWDNALSTLGIMIPFAGAYDFYFYGGANEGENQLLAQATLTIDDFKDMASNGYIQLKLGKSMALSSQMQDGDQTGACREDDFVEFGGGVWSSPNGSKGNFNGCQSPNDQYSKSHAIWNVLVKDLLTGTTTPIHLVYPLPYPNRVFVSKLNVVENRKYRCYDDFPSVGASSGCIVSLQNESTPFSDYRGHSVNSTRTTTLTCDVVTQKYIGCNDEETLINRGGLSYANYDEYETRDNSSMFLNAIAGAQMSEQMMHIWSGWHGECESGMFTDFSWASDPMTLASLAMSAYSSANYNASQAQAANDSAQAAATATADAIAKGLPEVAINGQMMSIIDAQAKVQELVANYTKLAEIAKDSLLGMVTGNADTIATNFTNLASEIPGASFVKDSITTVTTKVNNIIDPQSALRNLQINIANQGEEINKALAEGKNISEMVDKVNELSKQYTQLYNSLSNQTLVSVETTKTYVSDLLTSSNPAVASTAKEASMISSIQENVTGIKTTAQSWYEQFQNLNKLKDVGWTTINWTDIASSGYTIYTQIAANRDEMLKAWKAQQAYVLSGEGTANDLSANAYATCMASMGSNFLNTITRAGGANDGNTTSQELLTPWNYPMRISFQTLFELRSLVGEPFMQASYKVMNISNSMQVVSIVATNSAAYTQLAQVVCGGYQTAVVANSLNSAAASKPSMLDGLSNMSGEQAAKMAASMACSLAGPYAFACQLGLKLLTSFKSGNACNDEELASSQAPIQLKTNKFQKFGQCHFVKSTCSMKNTLGCQRKKYHYCCYDQIMTRIFAEGIKAQRGTGWDSCNDLTVNDLKGISFTPCKEGEDPFQNKCFPQEQYKALSQEIKRQIKKGIATDGATFMNQVQNAMEITQ